jgi:hypothetical protein
MSWVQITVTTDLGLAANHSARARSHALCVGWLLIMVKLVVVPIQATSSHSFSITALLVWAGT